MDKHLRYYGEFVSTNGHMVRVALYQDSATAYTPRRVDLAGDDPLVIEWGEREKYDVIHGSSATLKMISPADRLFTDLYTIEYGEIRLDVWRDGVFYWSGCIDPEQYEEPYETDKGYEVSLTFSDFGCLQRMPFDVSTGLVSITWLIAKACHKTQCVRTSISSDFSEDFDEYYYNDTVNWSSMPVGTTDGDGNNVILNGFVRTDNFYDEKGEAKSWHDVIKGVLLPLNAHIMQVNGKIFLFDLDTLYKSNSALTKHAIYWNGDSQNFGYDKTFNNIKITFSPYADAVDLIGDGCWPDSEKVNKNITALGHLDGVAGGSSSRVFSYYMPFKLTDTEWTEGFSMWTNSTAKNIILAGGRKVFKTAPQYDGDDTEGVIAYAKNMAFNAGAITYEWDSLPGSYFPISAWGTTPSVSLFTTPHAILPPQSSNTQMQLRLTLECLVDCRANPYEEPFGVLKGFALTSQNNSCSIAEQLLNSYVKFLYIPVKLRYKPAGSQKTYCYTNRHIFNTGFDITAMKDTGGYWAEETDTTILYLAYYNVDAKERVQGTALGKWAANRQAINSHYKTLSTQMQKQDDGQYITFPNIGNAGTLGEIWLEVMGNGWLFSDVIPTASATLTKRLQVLENCITFALVKTPELEIITDGIFDNSVNTEDVVYNAVVNTNAKEELTLDTICGTFTDGIPTARGAYFKHSGAQIVSMSRAGKSGPAEELLCGSLFSNYKDKTVVLSGEARIDGRFLTYTETNQSGKTFVCVSESQNIATDTTDMKIVELRPDTYEKL